MCFHVAASYKSNVAVIFLPDSYSNFAIIMIFIYIMKTRRGYFNYVCIILLDEQSNDMT